MNPWIIGGSAIAAGLLGWWLGTNHVEGKWAKADNAALTEQVRLYDDAIKERDQLQISVDEALFRLANSETSRITLSNELQEAINREPITRTVVREVPAGECSFPVIDTVAHFRLWNNSITLSGETEITTITAYSGYGPLWGAGAIASLDGGR